MLEDVVCSHETATFVCGVKRLEEERLEVRVSDGKCLALCGEIGPDCENVKEDGTDVCGFEARVKKLLCDSGKRRSLARKQDGSYVFQIIKPPEQGAAFSLNISMLSFNLRPAQELQDTLRTFLTVLAEDSRKNRAKLSTVQVALEELKTHFNQDRQRLDKFKSRSSRSMMEERLLSILNAKKSELDQMTKEYYPSESYSGQDAGDTPREREDSSEKEEEEYDAFEPIT